MTVAQTLGDLVVGIGNGFVGTPLPVALEGLPLWRLRLVNGAIVDAASNTSWHIDSLGQKHVTAAADRQPLTCALTDPLIKDSDGNWIVRPAGWTPVPQSVSPLQMRKALRAQDLKTAIDAYLATQDEEVAEAWEYATEIDRSNAMITAAATALGKTEAEIDDLFRLAATL